MARPAAAASFAQATELLRELGRARRRRAITEHGRAMSRVPGASAPRAHAHGGARAWRRSDGMRRRGAAVGARSISRRAGRNPSMPTLSLRVACIRGDRDAPPRRRDRSRRTASCPHGVRSFDAPDARRSGRRGRRIRLAGCSRSRIRIAWHNGAPERARASCFATDAARSSPARSRSPSLRTSSRPSSTTSGRRAACSSRRRFRSRRFAPRSAIRSSSTTSWSSTTRRRASPRGGASGSAPSCSATSCSASPTPIKYATRSSRRFGGAACRRCRGPTRRCGCVRAWPSRTRHRRTGRTSRTLLSRIELDDWLRPVLGNARSWADIARIDLASALSELLDWKQRRELDAIAPTHIEVPSGSRIPVDYCDPLSPVLAVRLQEVFGLTESPRIAGGRVAVTMHLLSPAGRPVQVTRDLAGFWRTSYFDVRKDCAAAIRSTRGPKIRSPRFRRHAPSAAAERTAELPLAAEDAETAAEGHGQRAFIDIRAFRVFRGKRLFDASRLT